MKTLACRMPALLALLASAMVWAQEPPPPASSPTPEAAARPRRPALRPGAPPAGSEAAWRSARWGMTVDGVLRAFPGEAFLLDPEQKLQDGNVVAAGIDGFEVDGQVFRVRFIFEGGKLALVSLRTPHDKYVKPETYERLQAHLAGEFGAKGEETRDSNFIDMRQTRWDRAPNRIDLKYVPGTLVVLYSPLAAR